MNPKPIPKPEAASPLSRPPKEEILSIRLRSDDSLLDAEVEVNFVEKSQVSFVSVWVGSRGAGRNNDYDHAVRAILTRLHDAQCYLFQAAVERRRDKRPLAERILSHAYGLESSQAGSSPYWREYSADAYPEAVRKSLGRVVALHGRPPGAKGGGNRQKAIRMSFVVWGDITNTDDLLLALCAHDINQLQLDFPGGKHQ